MIELLFFSGKHCGICQALKPKLLDEVTSKFSNIAVQVIDTSNQLEFAAQHLVFTLPVVIILMDHKEQYRFVRSFSVFEVTDKLERLIQLQSS